MAIVYREIECITNDRLRYSLAVQRTNGSWLKRKKTPLPSGRGESGSSEVFFMRSQKDMVREVIPSVTDTASSHKLSGMTGQRLLFHLKIDMYLINCLCREI